MFSLLFLAWAATAGPNITVVDNLPSITVDLTKYDVRNQDDLRRIHGKIATASDRVCSRVYGLSLYAERVACVKSAIADGTRQLNRIVESPAAAAMAGSAVISVS